MLQISNKSQQRPGSDSAPSDTGGKITPPPPNYDDIASLYSLGKQVALILIGGGGIEIKLEGNGPVEPAASRAIEDKHAVQ